MKAKFLLTVILMSALACGEKRVEYYGFFKEAGPEQIKPSGWLEDAMKIQREGLGTHYYKSGYPYDTGLWACDIPKGGNPIAKGWWPYEQSGYLVDGLFRLGIFLDDENLINLGKENCRYVLEHPRVNGMIGPEALGDNQWAISVFSRAMMAYYSLTRDTSVLNLYRNHFSMLPDSLENRQTCIIESMCKVYSEVHDRSLLHQAEKIWNNFANGPAEVSQCFSHKKMCDSSSISIHGVTAAEVAKQPAILFLYTGNERYLNEACGFFASVERDHELVDGIPSSSEVLSGKAADAMHETCDISDFLWSYGYMMMATGSAGWGDKMESSLANAAFGAVGKDFKTHQYFSSPNQLYATHSSSTADYGDDGKFRQAYRPGFDTECCSGNVHRMIPNFVSRCWMLTGDGDGVVSALLAPSRFTFRHGKKEIVIDERTDYPYRGEVNYEFSMEKSACFQFHIRIPGWTKGATVSVNGQPSMNAEPGDFFVLKRRFRNGDKVTLRLPMTPRLAYSDSNDCASVFLGPVLYSEKIDEAQERVIDGMKTGEDYPAWNVRPASAWNYSLDADKPIKVDSTTFPFELEVMAHKIPSWKDDGEHTPVLPRKGFDVLPEPVVIRMVPSGSTRIRMSTLPLTPVSNLVMTTKRKAESLMKTWAEGLLSLKPWGITDSTLAGNILCPACGAMHGRIIDVVWPMTWLWSRTGDSRYLDAAVDAVHWGRCNMQMSDGSYLNDPNHLWRGITIFSQISLGKALLNFGDKLPEGVRNEWSDIFDIQTGYIHAWMSDPEMVVNVNYRAAYPLAMELAYRLTNDRSFRESAKVQADLVMDCISEDGLLFGESKPMDILSRRGYRSVDIGYNVEESIPSMLEYAEMTGDKILLDTMLDCAERHLAFVLPDGGIDNSFGCRACKWTYWGSRTSDGILPMLSSLARNGVSGAMHAADLVIDLYSRLTDSDGLLAGGLFYKEAGEPTCIPHTFCHMKTLPGWIDSDFDGIEPAVNQSLLSEKCFGVVSYPSCGVHILGTGQWRATFSSNDYTFSGQKEHSTGGGSMTLLYNNDIGPLFAATIARYSVIESMNMQEQRNDGSTLCFTPRIQNGQYWSVFDDKSNLVIKSDNEVVVSGHLTDSSDSPKGGSFRIRYQFIDNCVRIELQTGKESQYIMPVISGPDDMLMETESGVEIHRKSCRIVLESNVKIERVLSGRGDGLAFNPVAGLMANYFVASLSPNTSAFVNIKMEK